MIGTHVSVLALSFLCFGPMLTMARVPNLGSNSFAVPCDLEVKQTRCQSSPLELQDPEENAPLVPFLARLLTLSRGPKGPTCLAPPQQRDKLSALTLRDSRSIAKLSPFVLFMAKVPPQASAWLMFSSKSQPP